MSETCIWHLVDGNEYGVYEISCSEETWAWEDGGTPEENGVAECPVCGKGIMIVNRKEEKDEGGGTKDEEEFDEEMEIAADRHYLILDE